MLGRVRGLMIGRALKFPPGQFISHFLLAFLGKKYIDLIMEPKLDRTCFPFEAVCGLLCRAVLLCRLNYCRKKSVPRVKQTQEGGRAKRKQKEHTLLSKQEKSDRRDHKQNGMLKKLIKVPKRTCLTTGTKNNPNRGGKLNPPPKTPPPHSRKPRESEQDTPNT